MEFIIDLGMFLESRDLKILLPSLHHIFFNESQFFYKLPNEVMKGEVDFEKVVFSYYKQDKKFISPELISHFTYEASNSQKNIDIF